MKEYSLLDTIRIKLADWILGKRLWHELYRGILRLSVNVDKDTLWNIINKKEQADD